MCCLHSRTRGRFWPRVRCMSRYQSESTSTVQHRFPVSRHDNNWGHRRRKPQALSHHLAIPFSTLLDSLHWNSRIHSRHHRHPSWFAHIDWRSSGWSARILLTAAAVTRVFSVPSGHKIRTRNGREPVLQAGWHRLQDRGMCALHPCGGSEANGSGSSEAGAHSIFGWVSGTLHVAQSGDSTWAGRLGGARWVLTCHPSPDAMHAFMEE